jgi:hypothetical protein
MMTSPIPFGPGQPPNIGIDKILAHRLERDPNVTKRKLLYSFGYLHKQ